MSKVTHVLVTLVMAAFGMLTVFLTTSIIFDLFGIREMEGNYVDFVVQANFIAGLLYLATAVGYYFQRKWALISIGTAAAILVAAAVGLLILIQQGGQHEKKTSGALAFRIGVTLLFAGLTFVRTRRVRKMIQ